MGSEKSKKQSPYVQLKEACSSAEDLVGYLKFKALSHNYYKRYTVYERLENWLEDSSLYLSDGNNWSDSDDKVRLNPHESEVKNFCACFTFSKSENVAMWMLYGGMQQDGVMIDFTPTEIIRLLSTEELSLGFWSEGRFVTVQNVTRQDFVIELSDVLYCDHLNDDSTTIKRSDARQEAIPRDNLTGLAWREKSYPWFFENECRLVVTIPKSLLTDDRIDTVRIKADKLYAQAIKNQRIYHSPNSERKQYFPSTLRNHMRWNLCEGNCPNKK